jgi:hypothetical protein
MSSLPKGNWELFQLCLPSGILATRQSLSLLIRPLSIRHGSNTYRCHVAVAAHCMNCFPLHAPFLMLCQVTPRSLANAIGCLQGAIRHARYRKRSGSLNPQYGSMAAQVPIRHTSALLTVKGHESSPSRLKQMGRWVRRRWETWTTLYYNLHHFCICSGLASHAISFHS